MKKLPIAVAVAAAMSAGAASAYTMGTFDHGLLVPQVFHNGAGDTTAVGLITHGCDFSAYPDGKTGLVYWTFFDENSTHITDGAVPMTNNDVYSFVWANESGLGLEGMQGYLVFFVDTDANGTIDAADGECLAGEAFHVVAADADVAYKAVWPIDALLDTAGAGIPDPTTMNAASITTLSAGAPVGDTITMRYSIANGDTTSIAVWSADDISGVYTVNMFDDEENRKSVNFALPNAEQNSIDPSTIVGRPADYVNGFIEWVTPDPATLPADPPGSRDNGADGNGVVSYSVIRSVAFSARQTVVNPHHP
ncbi:MAG TPA: hypothetical protein ENK62_07880 [Chromatiales bacterium]|nr:hypothetical protein [Chromatiales bacterium]